MNNHRIPDSELALKATRYVLELSAPFLYHHAVRTFLLADAVGRRQGISYDVELLYLGSIMHDLGLTGKLKSKERFEVAGADAAKAIVISGGLSEEKAEIVWDAIALHTSVGIASRKRPEISLVALGNLQDFRFRRSHGLAYGYKNTLRAAPTPVNDASSYCRGRPEGLPRPIGRPTPRGCGAYLVEAKVLI